MMTTSCIIRPFTNHERLGSYRKRQSLGRSAACEEKHQLLARRPLKRSSRIVIRVGVVVTGIAPVPAAAHESKAVTEMVEMVETIEAGKAGIKAAIKAEAIEAAIKA